MKALQQILLITLGWFTFGSSLSAFTEVADGSLKFTTDATYLYDSNFDGNAFGEDDTVYTLTPGLIWRRDDARIKINASAQMQFRRHQENTQFDGEYLNADLSINAPFAKGSPMSGSFTASYLENTSVNDLLNQRISSETLQANLRAAYRFRPKISADFKASYVDRSTAFYSDTEDRSYAIGATWHELWRNVNLSLDYRIRKFSTSGFTGIAADNDEDSFSVSLDGQLLPENLFPKLEATLAFRLQNNTSLRADEADRQILGFTAGLRWPVRSTTTLAITVNRDFDLAPDDRTTEIINYRFSVDQRVGRKVNLNFGLSMVDSQTLSIDRTSTRVTADLLAYYELNKYLNLNAGVSWSQLDSTYPSGDYSKHTFRLGANFRY